MKVSVLLTWSVRVLCAWLLLVPSVSWSQTKVLVIVCEGGTASGAPVSQLMASGLFSSVTAHDCASGVPNMSPYNAVLMYTNHSPSAGVFGDALANFVDAGGGVVIATYALSSSWGIGGRIFNSGYSPFASGPSSGTNYSGTLVQSTTHPVFNGVNVPSISYWYNGNYITPTLNAGATMLARDASGIGMVAVNASGRVIANNIYLNNTFQTSAELYKLIANELAFVAAPAKPGGLSGAVWWSRADSLSLSDNADISTWSNDANSSKNLTGSSTRPKYRNNNAQNINFNPVVEFTSTTATDAAAQFFSASSMLGTQTWNQAHYAMVGYPAAQQNNNWVFFEDTVPPSGYADGRLTFHLGWHADMVHWDAGTCCTTNRVYYTDLTMANRSSIWLFNMDTVATTPNGAKQGIRLDGTIKSTGSTPISFTGSNTNFRVGYASVDSPFRGVVAEGILFLGSSLSNSQTSQLESYLGVKYGATLGGNAATGTAYLSSAGGTVWASNTGYHHNVTGIARDDVTKLDQRISRSVNSGDQITATSNATLPSTASVISAQTGAAFATDKSYTIWGDNNGAVSDTAAITAGFIAGRSRSARVWRLQMTGSVPTQLTVCIPDALIPPAFLTGDLTDLKLTGATAADFSAGTSLYTMTAGTCPGTGVGVTTGVPGRYATFSSTVLTGMGGVGYFTVTRKQLDHIEITASANTGVTCAPTTYTVKACGDAACTSLYTGGLTGTLTLTGTGVTSQPSGGAPFTIAAGQSTTTVSAQVLSVSTATVGASGLSLTPGNAKPVFCGLGVAANSINACSMTVGSAGFLFSVPHHYAGFSQTVSIKAVRSSDNAQVCIPAFASVTRSIKATCSYVNPSSGTLPVQLGAVKLNAGNTNTACDATGQTLSLAFDANGATSTTLSYWDAGRARLSLAYSGSAGNNDTGLSLSGTADFVSAPMGFIVTDYPSVATAGSPFSFKIKALAWGSNANVMPNFGQESPREGVVLNWVRSQPLGVGVQTGSFAGSVGLFSGGAADVSNASWSEVGRISPTARLTSSSYLGSGLNSAGNPIGIMGWTQCASESGGSANPCVLPSGVTAAVYFGNPNGGVMRTDQSGTLPCSIAYFGDPAPGQAKGCHYTVLAGAGSVTTHIQVRPARLEVSAAPACGSFSYAGQPFGTTLTAKNALGDVTQNYAGVVARTINLSDSTANATGTLSGSVPASTFSLGVATFPNTAATAPVFNFGNKLTSPQTIGLRATDTDGVSSSGYDGSMSLRSGRLQMSNAFGGDKTALQVPLQLQYWSGKSWVKSSDDSCTVIPTASVVRAQTLNHSNTVANWSSAISGLSLSGGSGFITLGAPSPSGTGTVDLAINLGATTTDVSCLSAHPSSTGAGLPWLRSRQGSCASSFDRDPSARGTFGVYTPETQRSVHVREVF